MSMLSPEELQRLSPAESLFASPIPVQSVSSDEFMPAPQSARQREFEARVKEMGARTAKRLGMGRRRFFQTAAGMATAFLAMNDTYGPLFGVSRAEAKVLRPSGTIGTTSAAPIRGWTPECARTSIRSTAAPTVPRSPSTSLFRSAASEMTTR